MRITWFGHAFFQLSDDKNEIVVDPFVRENPACPLSLDELETCDYVLVTHGHSDHYGEALELCRQTDATLVSNYEITVEAEQNGVESVEPMNIGGSVHRGDVSFHMTEAQHSSGAGLGHQCGFVIETTGPNVYHAGDTGLFSDMQLIGEMLDPDVALLPIGDRFTMGPRSAARAVDFLGVAHTIPMHYNTFEPVSQNPEDFVSLVGNSAEVTVLDPGETHFTGDFNG